MTFNFDIFPNRRNTESAKWGVVDEGVLPMWVADMDFKSPEPVIQAMKCRVDHGVFGYADHPDGLKDSIVNWVSKRHGWEVSSDDIILVPGVVSVISGVLRVVVVVVPTAGIVAGLEALLSR